MGYAELIVQKLAALPADKQAQVFDFVEFLAAQSGTDWRGGEFQAGEFQALALAQALRDADDEPMAYRVSDCREIWS